MDTTHYSLIERASPDARRLLKVITLAEKFVSLSLLTEVWENQAKTPSLDTLLTELLTLGLLQKDEAGEETIYRFDESVRSSLLRWRQTGSLANLSSSSDTFFDEAQKKPLPCAIKQLQIENYQGIKTTSISAIPVDTQWLFLTGENSFGKTSVLQAIAIGLFGKFDDNKILTKDECAIAIELKNKGDNQIYFLGYPQFTHFVAYGSSRLQIQNKHSQN